MNRTLPANRTHTYLETIRILRFFSGQSPVGPLGEFLDTILKVDTLILRYLEVQGPGSKLSHLDAEVQGASFVRSLW